MTNPHHSQSTSVLAVGLMGGVGSGKSTVARLLSEQHAAQVLDADQEARLALDEADTIRAIADQLGEDLIDDDGAIDRKLLAARVFGESEQSESNRQKLEALVHPRVRARLAERIRRERARPAEPSNGAQWPRLLVLDVPLLIEGPVGEWCDVLVFIETAEADREKRVISNRGWTAGERTRREKAQAALARKREAAHFIIHNDGSLEDLQSAVAELRNRIQAFAQQPGPSSSPEVIPTTSRPGETSPPVSS